MAMEDFDPKRSRGDGVPQGGAEQRSRGPSVGVVLGGLALVALVFFVAQNTRDVQVRWLFFDATTSLWVVIVVSAILGVLIDRLFVFWWRRRRRPEAAGGKR